MLVLFEQIEKLYKWFKLDIDNNTNISTNEKLLQLKILKQLEKDLYTKAKTKSPHFRKYGLLFLLTFKPPLL